MPLRRLGRTVSIPSHVGFPSGAANHVEGVIKEEHTGDMVESWEREGVRLSFWDVLIQLIYTTRRFQSSPNSEARAVRHIVRSVIRDREGAARA